MEIYCSQLTWEFGERSNQKRTPSHVSCKLIRGVRTRCEIGAMRNTDTHHKLLPLGITTWVISKNFSGQGKETHALFSRPTSVVRCITNLTLDLVDRKILSSWSNPEAPGFGRHPASVFGAQTPGPKSQGMHPLRFFKGLLLRKAAAKTVLRKGNPPLKSEFQGTLFEEKQTPKETERIERDKSSPVFQGTCFEEKSNHKTKTGLGSPRRPFGAGRAGASRLLIFAMAFESGRQPFDPFSFSGLPVFGSPAKSGQLLVGEMDKTATKHEKAPKS